ncbi:MAG: hypothetical protein DRK00_07865, partial [Thermoprotei archaeon]
LWACLMAVERSLEYFIFPSAYVGLQISGQQVRESLRRVVERVKRRPPSHVPALALIVALSTSGLPKMVRDYELAVVSRGMRRVDLLEQALPLTPENYLAFADALKRRSERTVNRLMNLMSSALEQPPPGAEMQRRLHDTGMRVAQLIAMTLAHALGPEAVRYEVARLFYAQSGTVFEEYARRRGALLDPRDVASLADALEEVGLGE